MAEKRLELVEQRGVPAATSGDDSAAATGTLLNETELSPRRRALVKNSKGSIFIGSLTGDSKAWIRIGWWLALCKYVQYIYLWATRSTVSFLVYVYYILLFVFPSS